jgi:hypothetical protein
MCVCPANKNESDKKQKEVLQHFEYNRSIYMILCYFITLF